MQLIKTFIIAISALSTGAFAAATAVEARGDACSKFEATPAQLLELLKTMGDAATIPHPHCGGVELTKAFITNLYEAKPVEKRSDIGALSKRQCTCQTLSDSAWVCCYSWSAPYGIGSKWVCSSGPLPCW